MSLLNVYNTVVGKGYDLVPLGAKEIFIIPSEFDFKEVSDSLFRIRNNTRGYWFQMERLVSNNETLFTHGNPETPVPYEMKYITTKDSQGLERIFIFSKSVNHDCFLQIVNDLFGEDFEINGYMRILSAGFTDFKTCYGRSETCNKDSRKEDTELLKHFLGA